MLLDRVSYSRINPYSDALQLSIGDPARPDNVKVLQNLSIVQAQCATRGLAADPDALYLIELTDDRGILHNQWFQCPLSKWYNIRAPAYPQTFHPGSMNGGMTWTWVTMLQDIWQQMNTLDSGNVLGAWPGLPMTPAGTPEGFWFAGVPAWHALNDVLEYLGMTVACDLTQTNPYTIVVPGAADIAFSAAQGKYSTNLEDDLEWQDIGAGRVPGTIVVLFRRRNQVYGTEETVRYDAGQWDMVPLYQVSVAAPAAFASAVGKHFLWADFTVQYDIDSNPLAADVVTAAAIAQDRATQYFNKIYRKTAGVMTQTYAGALPFTTGPQCDGVCWYMDDEGDGGWRTEIIRSYLWSKLWE